MNLNGSEGNSSREYLQHGFLSLNELLRQGSQDLGCLLALFSRTISSARMLAFSSMTLCTPRLDDDCIICDGAASTRNGDGVTGFNLHPPVEFRKPGHLSLLVDCQSVGFGSFCAKRNISGYGISTVRLREFEVVVVTKS
jgi:hypothetical protein